MSVARTAQEALDEGHQLALLGFGQVVVHDAPATAADASATRARGPAIHGRRRRRACR